jgi:hypothetical protein
MAAAGQDLVQHFEGDFHYFWSDAITGENCKLEGFHNLNDKTWEKRKSSIKWQTLFLRALLKGLALGNFPLLVFSMIQWLRESWELTSTATKVLVPLGLLLMLALLFGLAWTTRNWQVTETEELTDIAIYKTRDISADIRAAQRGEDPLQFMSVAERAVLDRHFGAIGGIEAIASVASLRFTGKVTFESGTVNDIVVIKKEGTSMRTTIKTKQVQTTWVLSLEDKWRAVWLNGEVHEVRDLTEAEIEETARSIHVISELYLAMEMGWDLRYLGIRDFNYKMAHGFEVKLSPRHIVQYFIEPKTFLDIGRVDRVFEEDGTLTITRRLHSEHFVANGISLPGKVEVYLNDKLVQDFNLLSAEFNSGILDSVFRRPELPVTP